MADVVPILEFDPDPVGVFQPTGPIPGAEIPPAAVACHFLELVAQIAADAQAEPIMWLPSEPLWRVPHGDEWISLFYPGQGAPLAAASMERVIAAGCTNIVGCGTPDDRC